MRQPAIMPYDQFLQRFYYEQERDLLGQGGFAQAIKCLDRQKGFTMVLKMADISSPFRLCDEYKRAKKVPMHPHIAHYDECFSVEMPGGVKDVAVMQWYQLGDLESVLKTIPLDEKQKADLVRGILRGLYHIHQHGLMHLDLSAKNVLVQYNNGCLLAKISDFGISGRKKERAKFQGGTRQYASPEQTDRAVTVKLQENTDLWALGVLAYQIFLGVHPFPWMDQPEPGATQCKTRVRMNSVLLPDQIHQVPQPYRNLIQQCLVVDPAQRVQSAAILLTQLGEAPPESTPVWFQRLMRAFFRLVLPVGVLLFVYWFLGWVIRLIVHTF